MARVGNKTIRSRKKDRRKSVRRGSRGMALLVPFDSDEFPIAGVLMDASERGFRVMHSCAGLRRNQMVSFIHRFREGVARVIWNRAAGSDFEAGLEYLGEIKPRKPALLIDPRKKQFTL